LESFWIFTEVWCFNISVIRNWKLMIIDWIFLLLNFQTVIIRAWTRIRVLNINEGFSFSFAEILSFWAFMFCVEISSYFIYSFNFIIIVLAGSYLIIFWWTNREFLANYNFAFTFIGNVHKTFDCVNSGLSPPFLFR
jgi:hypothetical protein